MTDMNLNNIPKFPPKRFPDPDDYRIIKKNMLHALKKDIAAGNYCVAADEIAEKILCAQLFLFICRW